MRIRFLLVLNREKTDDNKHSHELLSMRLFISKRVGVFRWTGRYGGSAEFWRHRPVAGGVEDDHDLHEHYFSHRKLETVSR